MEIAEQDRHWEQKDVRGVSDKMTPKFDEFADEHPEAKRAEEPEARVIVPSVRGSVRKVEHDGIVYKGAGR